MCGAEELGRAAREVAQGRRLEFQAFDYILDRADLPKLFGDILAQLSDILLCWRGGQPDAVFGAERCSKFVDFCLLIRAGGPMQMSGRAHVVDQSLDRETHQLWAKVALGVVVQLQR